MVSATVRAAVTLCLAVHGSLFHDDLETERNRYPSPRCEKFQCPAFTRPVQKHDWKPWAYKTPDYDLPYHQINVEDDDKRKGVEVVVTKCTVDRDICMHTCGMVVRECHENYMRCYKHFCRGDKECQDNGEAFVWHTWSRKELVCEMFMEAQEEACDCVREAEFEGSLKKRLIDFYREHNAEKLNKKRTDLKDKGIWKKYKGKRPEMFFELFQRYRKTAVELRDRESLEQKLAKEIESENPDEEKLENIRESLDVKKRADAQQSRMKQMKQQEM